MTATHTEGTASTHRSAQTGSEPARLYAHTHGAGAPSVQSRASARRPLTSPTSPCPRARGGVAVHPARPLRGLHDGVGRAAGAVRVEVDRRSRGHASRPWARDDARLGRAGIPGDRVAAQAWIVLRRRRPSSPFPRRPCASRPTVVTLHGDGRHARTGTWSSTSSRSPQAVVVLDHRGSGDLRRQRRVARRATARTSPSSRCRTGTTTPCTWHPRTPGSGRDARLKTSWSPSAATSSGVCPSGDLHRHRAATPSCSASTSPTPASTSSTGCSSTTPCRTAAATSPTRARCRATSAHTVWIGDVLIRRRGRGHRHLRAQPQPGAHRRRPRRLGAEPRDRDRRDRRRRARQRHRPVRRRAAVLPAVARHPRGRGPPPGGPRLLRRHRSARSASPSCRSGSSRPSRPSSTGRCHERPRPTSARAPSPTSPRTSASASCVDGVPVAVVRTEGEVYAIHDVCSHANVALSEGEVEDEHHRVLAARLALRPGHRRAHRPAGDQARSRLSREDRRRRRSRRREGGLTRMSHPRDPRPARHRRRRGRHQGDPARRRPHRRRRARPTRSWAPTAPASRRWPTRSPATRSTRSPAAPSPSTARTSSR